MYTEKGKQDFFPNINVYVCMYFCDVVSIIKDIKWSKFITKR